MSNWSYILCDYVLKELSDEINCLLLIDIFTRL